MHVPSSVADKTRPQTWLNDKFIKKKNKIKTLRNTATDAGKWLWHVSGVCYLHPLCYPTLVVCGFNVLTRQILHFSPPTSLSNLSEGLCRGMCVFVCNVIHYCYLQCSTFCRWFIQSVLPVPPIRISAKAVHIVRVSRLAPETFRLVAFLGWK